MKPGLAVAVYWVIAEPLFAGAVQEMASWWLPRVAVTLVGASGTVAGITGLEASEAAPVPTPLVAVTVKV